MSRMRCKPSIVVARKVSASAASMSRLNRPLAIVSRLKMLRMGSRHSSAATMWSSEIVVSPIVVATASP